MAVSHVHWLLVVAEEVHAQDWGSSVGYDKNPAESSTEPKIESE